MIRVNGKTMEAGDRSLTGLLARLGYETDQPGIAVAVNGEVVRRSTWTERELSDGDEIDIVGAVQGG